MAPERQRVFYGRQQQSNYATRSCADKFISIARPPAAATDCYLISKVDSCVAKVVAQKAIGA